MAAAGYRLPRFTASILVLVCIATVDAAVFNDWQPDDFSYVTVQSDSSASASCPSGKVIYFGHVHHWNDRHSSNCLSETRANQFVCNPGDSSCSGDLGKDCEGDDEMYVHLVCGPSSGLPSNFVEYDASGDCGDKSTTCPSGKDIVWGYRTQYSDGGGNDDESSLSCLIDNRTPCVTGSSSCSNVDCDTEGDDECSIGIVCTSLDTGAFASKFDTGQTSGVSASCPSNMWAVYAFNRHTTSGEATQCTRDSTGRFCSSASYLLHDRSLTNPAETCYAPACNGDSADSAVLYLLCMCLPGYYRSGTGCSACDRGQVPNDARTSCVNCAAGRYCSYPDMDAVDCGSNGLGSSVYCPSGSHEPSLTPSGSYSTGGGTNTRTGYSTCPAGKYCVNGVQANCGGNAFYCPSGSSEPSTVPDGSYSTGGTSTTRTGYSTCPAGYYCTDGVQASCGGDAYYCPTGSSSRSTVPSGSYSTGGTSTTRTSYATCPAGYYCSSGVQEECGGNEFYCPGGGSEPADVPDGRYSTGGDPDTRTGHAECPAGKYCTGGVQIECGGEEVYCPAGSDSPTPVPDGQYSLGGTSTTREEIAECTAGRYCQGGVRINCGGNNKYCPAGASNPTTVSSGYYSTGGTSSSRRTGQAPCTAGYYCSGGVEIECGGNNKYCPAQASSATTVSTGYYSTGGTSTTRTGQSECTAGYYCTNGVRNNCGGANYYCPNDGMSSRNTVSTGFYSTGSTNVNRRTSQTQCEAGYYCQDGLRSTCGGNNYYCPVGASSRTTVSSGYYSTGGGTNTRSGQSRCQSGEFCVAGVKDTCAAGTRSDSVLGSTSCVECDGGTRSDAGESSCEECPEGHWCPTGHGLAPYKCGGPTWYCGASQHRPFGTSWNKVATGGADDFTHTSQTTCPARGACYAGMFVACGAGYRCTRTTSLEVSRDGYREMCSPEGDATKFCPAVAAGATSSPAQVVQAGYYSVGGRASCSTCGSEQFIDSDGMCRGCRRCFLTQYDAGGCDGLVNRQCESCHSSCEFGCTGPGEGGCRKHGMYISGGEPVECPPGSYCPPPASTTSKQLCPAGRFGSSMGRETSYCDGPCLHGYYCPAGSTRPDAELCDPACDGCTGPGASNCEVCAPGYRLSGGTCELCGTCGVANTDAGSCEAQTRTHEVVCPAGAYCQGGLLSGLCQEGYYCPSGSSTDTEEPCGDAGHYCPTGTATRLTVGANKYTTPESTHVQHRVAQATCPAGLTCTDGFVVSDFCSVHKARNPGAGSGWFAVDPAGDGSSTSVVWCDQDTDGGQWTTIYAASGADGEPPFASDNDVVSSQAASPLDAAFSLPLSIKVMISELSVETLVWRSETEWLRIDAAPLDAGAVGATASREVEVTIVAPAASGEGTVSVSGFMGYRRAGIESGGDFYISATSRASLTGDALLSCEGMYLFSSSTDAADSDAAWHSATGLGSWTVSSPSTDGCSHGDGSGFAMSISVRRVLHVSSYRSCREHVEAHPDASSGLYSLTSSTGLPVSVWCDMDTDGGGWSVLYATSGADGEQPVTSDVAVDGSALALRPFNLPRQAKAALSAASAETLVWRDSRTWLVADRALFGAGLGVVDSESYPVTIRAADGHTTPGRLGWSTASISNGGDFGIVVGDGAVFDGHDASRPMVNANCASHLVYSSSPVAADSDAGYDASAALGDWSSTTSGCGTDAEGGTMPLYIGVRDRKPLCRPGYTLAPSGDRCFAVLAEYNLVSGAKSAALCGNVDAYPVSIASSADNDALTALAAAAPGYSSPQQVWLGLSDAIVPGDAAWFDGSAVSFTSWASGDGGIADDSSADCTLLDGASGDWSSASCDHDLGLAACMVLVEKPPRSCKEIHARNPNAVSGPALVWLDGVGATLVHCDQDTDGGGWTVMYATDGADGAVPFVSDSAIGDGSEDTLANEPFNIGRRAKAALALHGRGGETLVRRTASIWLVVGHMPVDRHLQPGVASRGTWTATLRSGETTGRVWMGYSTDPVSAGGDFALSGIRFDERHDADADLVRQDCAAHLLYSLSSAVKDGDAKYQAVQAFGSWSGGAACDGSEGGGLALSIAVREPDASTALVRSCFEQSLTVHSNIMFPVYPDGHAESVNVGCDHDMDGGGWSKVYFAAAGFDGTLPITSATVLSTEVNDFGWSLPFNVGRGSKVALGGSPTAEILFRRSPSLWLKAVCDDGGVFDATFAGTGAWERVLRCNLEVSDGSVARGVVAWTTAASPAGGDFAVLLGEDAMFDRHDAANAPLLNRNCHRHLLYSYSSAVADGDAAYGVATGLGAWTATTPGSCGTGTEDSGMELLVAVREGPRGVWVPVLRDAEYAHHRLQRFQVRSAGFVAKGLRLSYISGGFTCDYAAHPVTAKYPWDACAQGNGGGFSMDIHVQGKTVLQSVGTSSLPSACQHASGDGPGGAITCRGLSLEVADNHVLTAQPSTIADERAAGTVDYDVDAFVTHACEAPTLEWGQDPATASCAKPGGWVKLVDEGVINGGTMGSSHTPTLPTDEAYQLHQVKVVYRSGSITCYNHADVPRMNGFSACWPDWHIDDDGVTPPYHFEMLINDALVVETEHLNVQPHVGGKRCSLPPPSLAHQGDLVCDVDRQLSPTDVIQFTWFEPRTEFFHTDDLGPITFELWGFLTPLPGAAPVATQPRAQRWVLLLSDAWFQSRYPNTQTFEPDLHGASSLHVRQIRAVHRSGYVSTSSINRPEWVWDVSWGNYGEDVIPRPFTLMKNGEMVLTSPDYNVPFQNMNPPVECFEYPVEARPDADFVCNLDMVLVEGDTLTPGHTEADNQIYEADNLGTMYIDLWALVDEVPELEKEQAADAGAIVDGSTCSAQCAAGLTPVGPGAATRQCVDGIWSAPEQRCIALAPFEAQAPSWPAHHAWSFDVSRASTHVVDDGAYAAGNTHTTEGGLSYFGTGVAVTRGAQSDIGCAVGSCVRVTGCGAGMQSMQPFNTTLLGGSRPKSLSVWARVPTHGRGSGGAIVPLLSLGNFGAGTAGCRTGFTLAVTGGVPVGVLGDPTCGDATRSMVQSFDTNAQPLSPDAWHHLALTYDGGRTTLYVDSTAVGSLAAELSTAASQTDSRVVLGGGSGVHQACNVGLDEARVFAFALTPSQVVQLSAAARRCPDLPAPDFGGISCTGNGVGDVCTFTCSSSRQHRVPTAGERVCQADGSWAGGRVFCVRAAEFEASSSVDRPTHWWDFDTSAAVDAASRDSGGDLSVPGESIAFPNIGALSRAESAAAAPALAVPSASTTVWRAAHADSHLSVGGAAHFDVGACSAGAFLSASAALEPSLRGNKPKTLAVWLRAASLAGGGDNVLPVASLGGSRASNDTGCAADAATNCRGGRLSLRHEGGTGGTLHASGYVPGGDASSAAGAIETGDWTHLAAVYTGSVLSLFVDGVEVASTTVELDAGSWAEDMLRVGRDTLVASDASRGCDMTVDDVKVFDYALSALDVAALASTGYKTFDLLRDEGLNCATSLRRLGDCGPDNAGVYYDTEPAVAQWADSASSPITMALSGRESCGVQAFREHNATIDVVPGERLQLSVTFSTSRTFSCDVDSAYCPSLQLWMYGHPSAVNLRFDEALAAVSTEPIAAGMPPQPRMVTVTCDFQVPGGVEKILAMMIKWSAPAGPTRGRITFHDIIIARGGARVWSHNANHPDTALTALGNPALSEQLVCSRHEAWTALNAKADALASCDAVRQQALRGSSFVSSPPVVSTQHRVVPTPTPQSDATTEPTVARNYRWELPATITSGAALAVQVRGVVANGLHGELRPPRAPTGQQIHVSHVASTSGSSSRLSSGDFVQLAPFSLRSAAEYASAASAVTVSVVFEARAEAGAELLWEVTHGDCGGVHSSCSGASRLVSGELAGGVVPGTATTCTDATEWCEFTASLTVATIPSGEDDTLYLWLRPALPTAYGATSRAADTRVHLQRVRVDAPPTFNGAHSSDVSVDGDGWTTVTVVHTAVVNGGIALEYNLYIDAGDAQWQLRVQDAAVSALPSGNYWIDPNGGSTADAVLAYCDHDTDDGGWTLVAARRRGAVTHAPADPNVGTSHVATPELPTASPSYSLGPQAAFLAVEEARVAATNNTVQTPIVPSPLPTIATELYFTAVEAGVVGRRVLSDTGDGALEVLYTPEAPHGVTADYTTGKLYWTASGTREILVGSMDGAATAEVLLEQNDGLQAINGGIFVDYYRDTLLFADEHVDRYAFYIHDLAVAGSSSEYIGGDSQTPRAITRDMSYRSCQPFNYYGRDGMIVSVVDQQPRNYLLRTSDGDPVGLPWTIALDTANDHMYWTELGAGEVRRASLAGENTVTLVSGLNLPTGLALDLLRRKMFYAEYDGRRVWEANMDGSNPRVVIDDTLMASSTFAGLFARTVWIGDDTIPTATAPQPTAADTASAHVTARLDTATTVGASKDFAQVESLAVSESSTVGLCTAKDVQRVWCAAHGDATHDSPLGAVCSSDSDGGLAFAGVTPQDCSGASAVSAKPTDGTGASLAGFEHVAVYVRGGVSTTSDDVPTATAAAEVAASLHMATAPQSETPLCGALPLGQSPSRAALSCAHILADYGACTAGSYTPPSGPYWLRPVARTQHGATLTHCLMDSPGVGGGWTLVADPGRSVVTPLASVETGDGTLRAMDVHGQAFDQVLLVRTSNTWCGAVADPVGQPSSTTPFNVAVSFSSDAAFTVDGTGACVATPAATGGGMPWDTTPPLAPCWPRVSVVASQAGGAGVVFSRAGAPSVHDLSVGAIAACDGHTVMAYVRSSMATASDAATAASSGRFDGKAGGFALNDIPAIVSTAATAVVSLEQTECEEFAVNPADTNSHPSFDVTSGDDPSAPMGQLAGTTPQCIDTIPMASDVVVNADIPVPRLASDVPSAATTSLYGSATSCAELLAMGFGTSGFYDIYPDGAVASASPQRVWCDQNTAGGGWTVVYVGGPSSSTSAAGLVSPHTVAGCSGFEYAPGTASLVQASTEVLLSFRGEDMSDVSNDGTTVDGAAVWAVVDTPDTWRHQHPATIDATDDWVLARIPGETVPQTRRLRYGSSTAVAGGCSGEWLSSDPAVAGASVAGRVCLEGTTAPFWGGFNAGGACTGVCTRSTLGSTGTSCSNGRRFSIAVRGGRAAASSAGSEVTGTADIGTVATRLRVQDKSAALAEADLSAAVAPTLGRPTSCVDLLRRRPDAPDGFYVIEPPSLPVQRVYCDMTHGGYQLCARLPAGGFDHSPEQVPMLSDWSIQGHTRRAVTAMSVNCSWSLVPGAVVSVSSSLDTADPTHSSAVLLEPQHGADAAQPSIVWRVSGRSNAVADAAGVQRWSGVGSFTIIAPGLSSDCRPGSLGATRFHGPLLHAQAQTAGSACAEAGALAGVHGCAGCADRFGAFAGKPWRGALSFWVKAAHTTAFARDAVPPPLPRTCADVAAAVPSTPSGPAALWTRGDDQLPVFAECDMGDAISSSDPAEAWTVVHVADPSWARGPHEDVDYAPGLASVVASAAEVRIAVSAPADVATVSALPDAWLAMPVPDAWRAVHPAAAAATTLRGYAMRSATVPIGGSGTVTFGSGAFAPVNGTVHGFCDGPWTTSTARGLVADNAGSGGATTGGGLLPAGRVCVSMRNVPVTVAWGSVGAPVAASVCSVASDTDAAALCSPQQVVSLAVRHDTARGPGSVSVRTCADVARVHPGSASGMYVVYPSGDVSRPARVYCDMDTAGGGWTEVFASVPDQRYAADVAGAASSVSTLLNYLPGTAGLVNDPRNEVLLAFRHADGTEAAAVEWASFPIPAEWRVRHPGRSVGTDVTLDVTVEGSGTPSPATLRFGRGAGVGASCGSPWQRRLDNGRICVEGTSAPFWQGFLGDASACGASTTTPTNAVCGVDGGLHLSIAVRLSAPASSVAMSAAAPAHFQAASSCEAVLEAGATTSGGYSVFPAPVVADTAAGGASFPATCEDVLRTWPDAPNGVYTILPPSARDPVRVYCDMASGGWMHCGTARAGSWAHTTLPVGQHATAVDDVAQARVLSGYSVDCGWALQAGAGVSVSGSFHSAEAATSSAVLTGGGHMFNGTNGDEGIVFGSAWRWPASGVVSHNGTAVHDVDELVLVQRQADGCWSYGFGLLSPSAQDSVACPAAAPQGVVSGAGLCSCGDTSVVLRGAWRQDADPVALWVRPPSQPTGRAPVEVACDLETAGGGWTVVFSTGGSPVGGAPSSAMIDDGDSSARGLASRTYDLASLPFVRGARSVLVAVRNATTASSAASAQATMPMPPQWLHAHPASYASYDLDAWPIALGGELSPSPRTLRFGWGAMPMDDGGCNQAWSAGGNANVKGWVCVQDTPSAPLWTGWASSSDLDQCTTHTQMEGGEDTHCSVSNVFTLSVKAGT